ncbi:transport system permease protein [Sulfurimonas denitrificans DSM 1251]|uniref:Transport system permease protein n=1 Tax=Sulfurimonas denitrificans (strain ATCC 33889 / DSM 1251) TaxID=326298 RepID=Q30UD5_SULDN|nr:iron ABC transporter permease [Sulfurimonas denitrificans]ABB43396.1 transport system permease protein [Sulfurimonas denitrificans DSM 1251]MDD3442254.1 iron ABC transporter permease [Sulfurimonas denitrificans]
MSRFFVWFTLTVFLFLSPFIGAVTLHVADIFNFSSLHSQIFFELRLPRVMFALFAGAILSISGLLFQTLFRNALMTPYTLGISSGAVLGAGIAIKLGLGTLIFGISAINIFGFLGAILTLFLLLYLNLFIKNAKSESFLLLGIALSLFYTSALMIIFYLGSAIQNDMLIRFTMGSLSIIGWQNPLFIGLITSVLVIVVYLYRFELQLLATSDESAKLKGLHSKKVTYLLLLISSFAVGGVVSISGPIGFVGLITPHIISMLYPSSISSRVLKTALFGALFLVFCDTIARLLSSQNDLPIGIVTALIGGPFFIYLIIRKKE